jgi:hypothetical protein
LPEGQVRVRYRLLGQITRDRAILLGHEIRGRCNRHCSQVNHVHCQYLREKDGMKNIPQDSVTASLFVCSLTSLTKPMKKEKKFPTVSEPFQRFVRQ